MKKPLETAWLGLQVGGAGSQVITKAGGKNSDGQADRDSDMVLCPGRAQKRNSVLRQHFCLGASCPFSSHPDARKFSSSLYIPGALGAVGLKLELRGSESKYVCAQAL